MVSTRRCADVAALVVVILALLAPPVGAEGQEPELLGTMPGSDEVLEKAPTIARAVFDRPVNPEDPGLVVVSAEGDRVDEGDPGLGDSPLVVEVSLPPDLPPGDYTASWQVRTDDGGVHEGQWRFRFGERPSLEVRGEEGPNRVFLVLAGVFGLIVASVGLWVARRHLR